ncbi:hypothetical protein NDU88_002175 [Pleurodeles waltl]|uniref:Transmembrane protein n=1 Tax=Pleurodeles waltl TaxID=8319 RepID=A0AAV7U8Y6_PLEWA|nr:hypothetical protein NDU88_002175 [Pleurodeles waltl]
MRALRRAFYRAVYFPFCQHASHSDARLTGNTLPVLLFAAASLQAALRVLFSAAAFRQAAPRVAGSTEDSVHIAASPQCRLAPQLAFPSDLRLGEEPNLNTRSVLLLLTLV